MKAVMRKYSEEIYRFALSLSVFLVAVLTGGDTERIAPFAVALVLLLCIGLLVLKSAQYLTLLFLHLSLLLIFCYDSFSVFIGYIWLLPVVVVAMAVYLIRRKPRFLVGASFWPLVAVSAATLLGGIGMISATDYFRPASLVFMAGLGPGLILSYWIMKNELATPEARKSLLRDLLYWGMTASAIVFWYIVPIMVKARAIFGFEPMQWGNNISTMLMLALPAALAQKRREWWHYAIIAIMFVATLLAGSRGSVLFVGMELLACCLWAWRTEDDYVKRLWNRTYFIYAAMAVGYLLSLVIYNTVAAGLINESEQRWQLFLRSLENFRENPLFGSGIGYRGNADLYNGKQGTINWYHMFVPQIVGGLGIGGILAWGYQLLVRARLSARAWRERDFGFALSYLGLLLMSMVNPGEFCPVPYAFLAVCCFAALENSHGAPNKKGAASLDAAP